MIRRAILAGLTLPALGRAQGGLAGRVVTLVRPSSPGELARRVARVTAFWRKTAGVAGIRAGWARWRIRRQPRMAF